MIYSTRGHTTAPMTIVKGAVNPQSQTGLRLEWMGGLFGEDRIL